MLKLIPLFEDIRKVKTVSADSFGKLLHGTAFADQIRQSGFKTSSSGFGQRGLKGVALTPDEKVAKTYAESHARYSTGAGNPEILVVKVSSAKLADMRGTDDAYDMWVKLGYDPMKDDIDRKYVQAANEKNYGFGITAQLKKLGFDGVVIDNTLSGHTSPEIAIFDSSKVRIVARKLSGEDYGPLKTGPKAPPASPARNIVQFGDMQFGG